jgi:speckle-type POZ protein
MVAEKECPPSHHNSPIGWPQFVKRDTVIDKAYGLLPNDRFTIVCEMRVVGEKSNVSSAMQQSDNTSLPAAFAPVVRLLKQFEHMFEQATYSDVVLCVQGVDIPVHKCVLAARSPVFRAMFR